MIFQALDDKKDCVGIYSNNQLVFNKIPEKLTKTWSYSPYLKGKNIDYAQIFVEGKKIEQIVPEHLKEDWEKISNRMKAFIASFVEAKVSLSENCFFELTPKNFLVEYCEVKNKITEHVLNTYTRPNNYEFYRRFNELLVDIRFRDLNLDYELMKQNIEKDKDLSYYRRFLNITKYISYNMFGAVTGRISTNRKSFPIQNFPKAYRNVLKPQNDWFISFDINAAELRTAIGLVGGTQPDEDIYEMINREVFNGSISRSETKDAVISWLYGSSNPYALQYASGLDSIFKKEELKNNHWDGSHVKTIYGRKIESDEHHAIPYINQSTFIDLFHRQIIKTDDYLNDKKSFVSFLLHDEAVFDVSNDERDCIVDLVKIVQDTQFGKFIVNVKAGKNYGDMKKLKLKV